MMMMMMSRADQRQHGRKREVQNMRESICCRRLFAPGNTSDGVPLDNWHIERHCFLFVLERCLCARCTLHCFQGFLIALSIASRKQSVCAHERKQSACAHERSVQS